MAPYQQHMAEALVLAERGLGAVEPNPMVGAVLVRDGQVIGRGWHKTFGGPHAEIEALTDARTAGVSPAGATLVVTLEPCHHHGKTPPCTEAIIAAGIAAVVAAMPDPSQEVSGAGFKALRAAGVDVTVGVGREAAERLLDAYCKLCIEHRPWVICKWAQTLDGRIATRTGHSQWISCQAARQRVGEYRRVCDGVAVGVGTVTADDPLLTNRTGAGRQPVRLVLDDALQIPPDCRLVRSIDQAPLVIATTGEAVASRPGRARELEASGAELLQLPAGAGGVDLPELLAELGRRQWTRLLVEGGSKVLGGILRGGLADALRVFLAPRILGGAEGLPCAAWQEIDAMDRAMRLPAPSVEKSFRASRSRLAIRRERGRL